MTAAADLLDESAEELFEDAPCAYVTTLADGTIVRVNRTFEAWTGHGRDELLGLRRFQDLLTVGGRIYHETHYAPLLQMQGSVREIAVEIVRADGSRLPALINSVLREPPGGGPGVIRTTVFDATDRRRYEEELLQARRREREIAEELQRSLLSGTLPEAPGLEIAVAYHPGVTGIEVGGDWYDAFWLEPGAKLGLVVGDVVGRGITAAATMGQLRSAVRALAATGLPPGALLEALDAFSARHEVGGLTTLVYGELDLATHELRYSCAGHPPPAIVRPGEEPCFAWEGRSLPLDAHVVSGKARDEGVHELSAGTTVLLYTDGLVERRTLPLAEGLDELLAQLSDAEGTAAELVEALARTLAADRHDDMCLLAVRLAPS